MEENLKDLTKVVVQSQWKWEMGASGLVGFCISGDPAV